jgi:hypothetical protein
MSHARPAGAQNQNGLTTIKTTTSAIAIHS